MPIPNYQTAEERQAAQILSQLGPEYTNPDDAVIEDDDLQGLLRNYKLDPRSVIKEIRSLITDESPQVRMRAMELAVKMNGMLDKDSDVQGTTFTVILQTKKDDTLSNPILLPRELIQENDATSNPLTAADPTTGELIEQNFIAGIGIDPGRFEAPLPPVLHSGE